MSYQGMKEAMLYLLMDPDIYKPGFLLFPSAHANFHSFFSKMPYLNLQDIFHLISSPQLGRKMIEPLGVHMASGKGQPTTPT